MVLPCCSLNLQPSTVSSCWGSLPHLSLKCRFPESTQPLTTVPAAVMLTARIGVSGKGAIWEGEPKQNRATHRVLEAEPVFSET